MTNKELYEEADKIASEILSKIKPKKEKCMHCFGQLDNPVFCNRVLGHKGEHSARLYWNNDEE